MEFAGFGEGIVGAWYKAKWDLRTNKGCVSLGIQGVFKLLGCLGIRDTKTVSVGVSNNTSEFIIENMTGEVGKVYDKAIQEIIKKQQNER